MYKNKVLGSRIASDSRYVGYYLVRRLRRVVMCNNKVLTLLFGT